MSGRWQRLARMFPPSRAVATVILLQSCIVLCAAGSPPAEWTTLHVSVAGDDRAAGDSTAPLASVEEALARAKRLSALGQPAMIQLGTGRHELRQTIVITPEDFGDAGVIIAGQPDGSTVLSGGVKVAEFRDAGDGVWIAPLPRDADERPIIFSEMWVNGRRATRARDPNEGFHVSEGLVRPLVQGRPSENPRESFTSFRFTPGQFRQWERLDDAVVTVYHSWLASIHKVVEVDEAQGIVRFANSSGHPFGLHGGTRQRFIIENVPEAFDAPGEWIIDSTRKLVLYRPLADEKLATAEVIASRLPRLVELRGVPDRERFVSNIVFRDISFQHADRELDLNTFSPRQAFANVTSSALYGVGVRDVRIERCELTRSGAHGVCFDRGSQRVTVLRTRFHELGGGGAYFGEPDRVLPRDLPPHLWVADNTIENCIVHDVGLFFRGSVGILGGCVARTRIAHNDVSNSSYTGISVGWGWNLDRDACQGGNVIENNRVRHLLRGELSDGGGIYLLNHQPGTVVRGNVIHDIYERPGGAPARGIYLDGCTAEVLVENNLVHDVGGDGVTIKAENNLVRNNIFAFAGRAAMRRWYQAGWAVPGPNQFGTITFERNIVYQSNNRMVDGYLRPIHARLDRNLYFGADNTQPLRFLMNRSGGRREFHSLKEWTEETGHDAHSLVADPGFVDAEARDFRLRDGTPTTRVGFVPFDEQIAKAGVYGDPAWVDLARSLSPARRVRSSTTNRTE